MACLPECYSDQKLTDFNFTEAPCIKSKHSQMAMCATLISATEGRCFSMETKLTNPQHYFNDFPQGGLRCHAGRFEIQLNLVLMHIYEPCLDWQTASCISETGQYR